MIELPVVVKPNWDCMAHGVSVVRQLTDLDAALMEDSGRSLLVERFIDGETGSVEIIGEPGKFFFQYPCWTGSASRPTLDTFDTLRVCGEDLFPAVRADPWKSRISTILSEIGFRGACCVDFVSDGNDVFVLEINPRISEISCLSAAASGVNAFREVFEVATGHWSERFLRLAEGNRQWAIQAGGLQAERLEAERHRLSGGVRVKRAGWITVDGARSRSLICSGDRRSMEELCGKVGTDVPSGVWM